MNKKILSLSALALVISLAQAPFALACHEKCMPGSPIEKMAHQLDLTTDQKKKIMDIRAQMMSQVVAKQQEMRAAHKQIDDLFQTGTVDESKLDAVVMQQQEIFGAMLKMRLMERKAIMNVLTDAQKVKLHNMIKAHDTKKHMDHDHDGE